MRVLVIAMALAAVSCALSKVEPKIDVRFEEVCIEGVLYLKFVDAVTVKYTEDEVIEHCLED